MNGTNTAEKESSSSLCLELFLKAPGVLFDVRSPAEYQHGHLPGALNLPLFSNEERAQVGTFYKQRGKDPAVELGLRLVGTKLADFVSQARALVSQHPTSEGVAKVYCWRGGMRSNSMAWLLRTGGLSTLVLQGGYKSFRHWCLERFEEPRRLCVIGGCTGSGKTALLQVLKQRGHQVLDLEALANHRGSAYGKVACCQPTTEQFENAIAMDLATTDKDAPLWVEDESQRIGTCKIPDALFARLRASPLVCLERPVEERIALLLTAYHQDLTPDEELAAITKKIERRLGPQRTTEALTALTSKDYRGFCKTLLSYYDTCYQYGLSKKNQPVVRLYRERFDTDQWTDDVCSTMAKLERPYA